MRSSGDFDNLLMQEHCRGPSRDFDNLLMQEHSQGPNERDSMNNFKQIYVLLTSRTSRLGLFVLGISFLRNSDKCVCNNGYCCQNKLSNLLDIE